MQFKQGTHVYTIDGKDVGAIDRVVLDPKTDEVTHVVVRRGWLFSEDKVVPISSADCRRLALSGETPHSRRLDSIGRRR